MPVSVPAPVSVNGLSMRAAEAVAVLAGMGSGQWSNAAGDASSQSQPTSRWWARHSANRNLIYCVNDSFKGVNFPFKTCSEFVNASHVTNGNQRCHALTTPPCSPTAYHRLSLGPLDLRRHNTRRKWSLFKYTFRYTCIDPLTNAFSWYFANIFHFASYSIVFLKQWFIAWFWPHKKNYYTMQIRFIFHTLWLSWSRTHSLSLVPLGFCIFYCCKVISLRSVLLWLFQWIFSHFSVTWLAPHNGLANAYEWRENKSNIFLYLNIVIGLSAFCSLYNMDVSGSVTTWMCYRSVWLWYALLSSSCIEPKYINPFTLEVRPQSWIVSGLVAGNAHTNTLTRNYSRACILWMYSS